MGAPASVIAADPGSAPDARELWKAYPLEQQPSTAATPPARGGAPQSPGATASDGREPSSSHAGSGGGPSMAQMVVIAAGAVLLVLAVVTLRRTRRTVATPATPRAELPPAAPRTAAAATAPSVRVFAPAGAPPRPAARNNNRASAAGEAPVCQIRWDRRSRSFYAASVDGKGVEHWLSSSAPLEKVGPAPPAQTPEARAALGQLSKRLREQGWRPMRAKGVDFDERRWYARRFRRPIETERADAAATAPESADEAITDRSAGPR